MKFRIEITQVIEYEPSAADYQSSTPEEWLAEDIWFAKDDPSLFMDDEGAEIRIKGEVIA